MSIYLFVVFYSYVPFCFVNRACALVSWVNFPVAMTMSTLHLYVQGGFNFLGMCHCVIYIVRSFNLESKSIASRPLF